MNKCVIFKYLNANFVYVILLDKLLFMNIIYCVYRMSKLGLAIYSH